MNIDVVKRLRLEYGRRINERRKRNHILHQLFWECTLKCNLKCLHCGSDCKAIDGQADMPLSDFLYVLDNICENLNPKSVLVITTGGEPLVRPDIIECGKEITSRGFIWGMVSNGLLLSEQRLDELIGAGLRTIAISLDGFQEEHNWMRGNSYSFEKAVSAIKALGRKCITWDVITCVNKKNIDSLYQFKDFLISIGVKQWRIFTVFPEGRAKDNDELQLSSTQMKYLMEFISMVRKKNDIKLSYSCEGFLGSYEYEVRDYQYFCQAGINVASILNDGSISGCLSIRSNYNQGNIYTDNFIDVWNNRFNEYRDRSWMKKGICEECEMWKFCEGNGFHLRDENGNLSMCNLHRIVADE